MATVIKSRQEGDERCITCAKRTCLLLVVRMSLSELSRATPSGKTFEGRAGDIFVIKAGEIHSFKVVGDSPLVQLDVHLSSRFIQENL